MCLSNSLVLGGHNVQDEFWTITKGKTERDWVEIKDVLIILKTFIINIETISCNDDITMPLCFKWRSPCARNFNI